MVKLLLGAPWRPSPVGHALFADGLDVLVALLAATLVVLLEAVMLLVTLLDEMLPALAADELALDLMVALTLLAAVLLPPAALLLPPPPLPPQPTMSAQMDRVTISFFECVRCAVMCNIMRSQYYEWQTCPQHIARLPGV